MIEDLLLGIDVGTQGVKGVLIQPDGKVVASHYVEHGSIYPYSDWVEQDVYKNWWFNPVKVIQELLRTEGVRAEAIKAIGISGLYPAMGPTDGEGRPLAGAIMYSDNRAVAEVEEVNRELGLQLTSEELTPKLIWFLRNRPELAANMEMFFDAAHYLVYKLTGEYVVDTMTTGLWGAIYESPTASWREEVCEKFGIPMKILPKAHPPATIVGQVHAWAAENTGLAEGTPVLTGMPDLTASLISAGTVHQYETCAYYGTAGLVPVMKDDLLNGVWKPYPISERGLTPQDGYIYDYPSYCLSTGDAVRWFRDQFGQMELARELNKTSGSAYSQLDELARVVPPGSDGLILLPYFQGQRSPVFNPWAVGVYFGLKQFHTRGHLFRAILESFAFTIRHGFESFYPNGHPVKRLVATGGGARSPLWRQIVSDITGIRQEYVPEADGPVGAAYVAGLSIGWYQDFEVLRNEWVKVTAVNEPNPETQSIYEKYYEVYKDLHTALTPVIAKHHEAYTSLGGIHV